MPPTYGHMAGSVRKICGNNPTILRLQHAAITLLQARWLEGSKILQKALYETALSPPIGVVHSAFGKVLHYSVPMGVPHTETNSITLRIDGVNAIIYYLSGPRATTIPITTTIK